MEWLLWVYGLIYTQHLSFSGDLQYQVNIGSDNGLLPDGTKPLPKTADLGIVDIHPKTNIKYREDVQHIIAKISTQIYLLKDFFTFVK